MEFSGPRTEKRTTRSVQPNLKGPTSLNMGMRKRETERIEKENHAFAKRLFDKQAVLKKKALDSDWASHLKYKRQIGKMGYQAGKSAFQRQSMRGATAGGYSMQNIAQGGVMNPQIMDEEQ